MAAPGASRLQGNVPVTSRSNGKREFWTIVLTVLLTIIGVALAMNFAIPEKRLEHKVEHKYAIADAQFRREMGALLGPAIQPGNRVTDLENGDEIFPAMLEAIRSAQRTITFETYIYWSGEIGKRFADALSERARAGVDVAVTIDAVGGRTSTRGSYRRCARPASSSSCIARCAGIR